MALRAGTGSLQVGNVRYYLVVQVQCILVLIDIKWLLCQYIYINILKKLMVTPTNQLTDQLTNRANIVESAFLER